MKVKRRGNLFFLILLERGFLPGFTLIEILIATFIIGLTLVAAIEMFVVTTKTNEESGNDVIALNLVQQRLEEVKKLQYGGVNIIVGTGSNAADGFLPALTDVSTDVYLTGFYLTDSNTYRVNSSLAKMNPQRRLDLITRINWVDDLFGGTAQDYKQVNVTAFWQESGRIKSLSLSTYAYYVGLPSIGAGVTVPDTGQTGNYTSTFGEDSDYNTTSQLSYTDNGDGTIEDEITGLTWVKDPSIVATIGGTHTWVNAVANCTGLTYAARDDWRLPNIKELWSIVHYQNTPRTIAPVFNCTDSLPRRYWSSTTNSGQTLAIDFTTGQCSGWINPSYIRPVRNEGGLVDSGQTTSYTPGDDGSINPAAIQPSFTDNEDGTISDNISGLMWIKNPANATIGGTYNWGTAITACENLDYANSIKWRLPNVKELMSVLNYRYFNPAIATGAGNFTVTSGTYWTSTSDVAGGLPNDNAAAVNLGDGTSLSSPKTNPYRILPVCGGEL